MLGPIGRIVSLTLGAAIVAGGLGGAGSGFMVMLPALCLLVPLLLDRYPGERRIDRIRRARAAGLLRPSAESPSRALRAGHAQLIRGGRLIAASIAVRPPPAIA